MSSRRALLSVSDKSGLEDFARGLRSLGFELLSTGGTKAHLEKAGLPVTAVADVTGSPEILGGRVKTLHPRIHGGILARRSDPHHVEELALHAIGAIDLVAVNLYPFARTVARAEVTFDEAIENIDIGGPAMVRAAAKNHADVLVVVAPSDYPEVLRALASDEATAPLRRRLALKAYRHTASYDAAIAHWFEAQLADAGAPPQRTIELALEQALRYGENPHQHGALYRDAAGPGILGGARQSQGKELSWNNLLDADAARKLVALFDEPAVVIVKHNNPCGVGRGADLVEAYHNALATDPVSAFGSIVALNRPADRALADAMADLFVEVLVAPAADEPATSRFAEKKNLRVLLAPPYLADGDQVEFRAIDGGFLAQPPDAQSDDPLSWTCPTRRQPTAEERHGLEFAWKVARYVKSNAIVIANQRQTLGIGAGQMSRVDSCRIAIQKAQADLRGSVAASDAFFPFRDGLDLLVAAGVTAVVQPGGSKRDADLIAAADEGGVAMLMTGVRHFRH